MSTSRRSYLRQAASRALLVLMALGLLAGCAQAGNAAEQRERVLRDRSGDISIGVVWPFEHRNDMFREGLELALQEINEVGVLNGHKLTLIEKDDDNSVTQGLAIAQAFADDRTVTAVIGHRSSTVTVPASLIYANAGIPLLAPAATSPQFASGNSPLLFRMIPDDTELGGSLAAYAAREGYRSVAIYYTDDEYGRGLANAFEDKARTTGLEVVDRVSGYKDTADLLRMADKWTALGAETILFAGVSADAVEFLNILRADHVALPVIGGDGLDNAQFEAAGAAAEGTVVASIYDPNSGTDENRKFREKFQAAYGAEPTKWAAQAYDSLHLLALAIDKANSRAPSDIAKALRETESWPGAVGPRTFGPNGDVSGLPIVMKRVTGGKFQYIE